MEGTNQDDVDISRIDEMLKLTPEESLDLHDQMLATALELQDAFHEFQADQPAT